MPLTSTIRQAIALTGGEVEQTGGGCETLRLQWGALFIRISSQEDTLMLPDTLDGEAVSVGVYFAEDEEEGLRDDLCCNFESLREALTGTIAGVPILHSEGARALIAALPSDAPESEDDEEEALFGDAPVSEASAITDGDWPTNAARLFRLLAATRIEQLLEEQMPYCDIGGTYTEAITDLLSDLRHFCDRQKLDFAAMDRAAYRHYIEEKGR